MGVVVAVVAVMEQGPAEADETLSLQILKTLLHVTTSNLI